MPESLSVRPIWVVATDPRSAPAGLESSTAKDSKGSGLESSSSETGRESEAEPTGKVTEPEAATKSVPADAEPGWVVNWTEAVALSGPVRRSTTGKTA